MDVVAVVVLGIPTPGLTERLMVSRMLGQALAVGIVVVAALVSTQPWWLLLCAFVCITLYLMSLGKPVHQQIMYLSAFFMLPASSWSSCGSCGTVSAKASPSLLPRLEESVMPEELEVPLLLNIVAVAVGASSGALRAGEEEDIDVVGMFALGLCFGFGGGLVRDLLLGNLPPAALRTPVYLLTVLAATIVASLFLAYLGSLQRPIWVLDSLTFGLFAAVGANAALLAGLPFLPAILIGALASVGGLVLAEFLLSTPSSLLYTGPPSILAGLAGALTYTVLYDNLPTLAVTALAVLAAFLVRLSGPLLGFRMPQPNRDKHHLRASMRRLWRRSSQTP